MITIDQLLESVDLDFEPRWVTKDKNGTVNIWSEKPYRRNTDWDCELVSAYTAVYEGLKLSEFSDKDWQECIYEVPRKTTGDIVKLGKIELSAGNMSTNQAAVELIVGRLNLVIDAVNELKAKFALPTLNPDLTDEDLRKMMCDPKYWRDKDSATIQKVQNGFNKLYGDKN